MTNGLKLVEKKVPVKEPIPEIHMKTPEEIATDLEKMISFDDELGEMEEEATEGEYVASTSEEYEDEEWDEDDEWSKFDGF